MKFKKIISIFLLGIFLICFNIIRISFAAETDTRTAISSVVATSTEFAAPTYGQTVNHEILFTVTEGQPARFNTYGWYRLEGTDYRKYEQPYFIEGSYQYQSQVRVEGTSYKLAEATEVKVNDAQWVQYYETMDGDTYSFANFKSPIYEVVSDPTFPLTFGNLSNFDIGTSYTDTAITSYSVANAVVGGTKPYTFSKTSGPSWINVASDGTISGTPSTLGSNDKLVIRVTDATSNYKEIEVNVGETLMDLAKRTNVTKVTGTSNIQAPIQGNALKTNFNFTFTDGSEVNLKTGNVIWQKQNGTTFNNYYESTYTEGTYRLNVQFRIDNPSSLLYKFPDDVSEIEVTIDGVEWTVESITNYTLGPVYSLFFAYSSEYEVLTHTHNINPVAKVDATCTTDGYEAHYKCDVCGNLFKDSEGTQKTNLNDLLIAKGHKYGTLIPQKDPNCTNTGVEAHYECSECHKLFNSYKSECTLEALTLSKNNNHDFDTWNPQVDATCATEGTKAYKDCKLCKKHFDNSNNEITDLIISKNDHHNLESTWTKTKEGHYHLCKNVGCPIGHDTIISHTKNIEEATETQDVVCTICEYIIEPKKGHVHNLTFIDKVDATCTQNGSQAYYLCSGDDGCNQKFKDNLGNELITDESTLVILASHDFDTWNPQVDATCATEGTKAYKDCKVCKKHFDNDNKEITDLIISKNDHHNLESTWTKTKEGHYHLCKNVGCPIGHDTIISHTKNIEEATETQDVVCTICEYIIEPKKGHVHNLTFIDKVDATCTQNGSQAYYLCSGDNGCNQKFKDNLGNELITDESTLVILASHDFDTWNPQVDATCSTEGTKAYKDCKVCKKHFDNDNKEITDLIISKNDHHEAEVGPYQYDQTKHWREYPCCHQVVDEQDHQFSKANCSCSNDNTCSICNAKQNTSSIAMILISSLSCLAVIAILLKKKTF